MRVLVDCDGVVADSHSAFLRSLSKITGEAYKMVDITDWDYKVCLKISSELELQAWQSIDLDFPPYIESLEGVKYLRNQGHEIVFVTAHSRHIPTWVWRRDQWLEKYFPGVPVVHTKHKHYVSGDAFIDDKPENLGEWCKANPGKLGILFAQPWNKSREVWTKIWDICRTDSWDIIAKLVANERLRSEVT